ncbi:hypothetical protein D1872_323560 [compost metagenome]
MGDGYLPDGIEASGGSGLSGQDDSAGQQSQSSGQQVGSGETASFERISLMLILVAVVAIVVLLLGARWFYTRRK